MDTSRGKLIGCISEQIGRSPHLPRNGGRRCPRLYVPLNDFSNLPGETGNHGKLTHERSVSGLPNTGGECGFFNACTSVTFLRYTCSPKNRVEMTFA